MLSSTEKKFPMISPRHVSAAARGCLVWDDQVPMTGKKQNNYLYYHQQQIQQQKQQQQERTGEDSNNKSGKHHHHAKHRSLHQESNEERRENRRHSPGRAHVGPPPTLRTLHHAGGHEHDSNEGIKQSIMVEKRGKLEYAFPAWGGAGGGYYSCFAYTGGKDLASTTRIVPTRESQGRRRVLDQDVLAIGAQTSSFVPIEKSHGLRHCGPPQRKKPMDGKSARGLHQDIGLLNVERIPSSKKMMQHSYKWQNDQFNVMTEASAPTDTRTQFQIVADAKRQRNRQSRKDFLAHLKSEGQYKAVNRVPIRSTLTQRRVWDEDQEGGNNDEMMMSSGEGGGVMMSLNQDFDVGQQLERMHVNTENIHLGSATSASNNNNTATSAGKGVKEGQLYQHLSPRARKYLAEEEYAQQNQQTSNSASGNGASKKKKHHHHNHHHHHVPAPPPPPPAAVSKDESQSARAKRVSEKLQQMTEKFGSN